MGATRAVRLILVGLVLLLAAACAEPVPQTSPTATGPSATSPSPSMTSPSPTRPAPTPTLRPSPRPTPPPKPSPSPTSWPTSGLPASLIGSQWTAIPTSKKVVALTFDAGANADAVPSILATLAGKGVPGTFFLTGKWVETYPEYAAQIGARYPVGNHSYSHPDLTTLSDAAVRAQVEDAEAAIDGASHRTAKPLFRFPFGASSQHLIELLNSMGYGCINWTVDTRGWMGTSGGQSVDSVYQRVIDAAQPGEIVIMHVGSNPDDGSTLDAEALPRVIDQLRSMGYSFVTLDQFV